MPTLDKGKNQIYVRKCRDKLKSSMGIENYRKMMATNQRDYQAKKKALKNAHIQDRRLRSIDINELVEHRKNLKKSNNASKN